MKQDIAQLLADNSGVLRRSDHPKLAQRLDRLRSNGELVRILPGILVLPDLVDDWETRLRAGIGWLGPDAIVTGHAAARLTFWPDCPHDDLSFARAAPPPRQQGWPVMRMTVPPEMVRRRGWLLMTSPAYTAVELAVGDRGGEIIDRALRSRTATLRQMWDALAAMPNRRGNEQRRWLLNDSRDKPWSELERAGHRLLRRHHIKGWQANAWAPTASGGYAVDVLFRAQRLVVEFDGYAFHSDADAFEWDRRRRNELVLSGYTVINFTWAQVITDPDWVIDCIRQAIRIA